MTSSPPGASTRVISSSARAPSSKCSIAQMDITRSKLASANGSASASPMISAGGPVSRSPYFSLAAEHRSRVADQRRKSLRSWDYGNLRIDTLVAPMSILTNALGLLLAVALGGGQHGIEAVVVAFTYYSNATQIMFEFNQIYRRLESSLTEAAQFTELLLTPPTVLDPVSPEPLLPGSADVRFEQVTFAH